jgi:hypothetical protein
MKPNEKIIRATKEKIYFLRLPKKAIMNFDQALLNLGVQIKN